MHSESSEVVDLSKHHTDSKRLIFGGLLTCLSVYVRFGIYNKNGYSDIFFVFFTLTDKILAELISLYTYYKLVKTN